MKKVLWILLITLLLISMSCATCEKTEKPKINGPSVPFYGMEFKTSEELTDYQKAMLEVYSLYALIVESEIWFDTYIYDYYVEISEDIEE